MVFTGLRTIQGKTQGVHNGYQAKDIKLFDATGDVRGRKLRQVAG